MKLLQAMSTNRLTQRRALSSWPPHPQRLLEVASLPYASTIVRAGLAGLDRFFDHLAGPIGPRMIRQVGQRLGRDQEYAGVVTSDACVGLEIAS